MTVFSKEADFEQALIEVLFTKGWEKEILYYPTEQDLIENWAKILFDNNRERDRLNDQPLTDGEMAQILEQIENLRTPLKLNGFINGGSVSVKRDNPADPEHFGKEISLKIYNRKEIAAGSSRYQIARQPQFPTKSPILHDRRGDLMLLINGMPVFHLELKRNGVPVSQATAQIEKYAREGIFTGLFSLVQIFVAMEPNETVYFANPGPDGRFNPDYYFHWEDFNNELINNWKDIAVYLLSIPMAHQLIGYYTIADQSDGILKVLRSYQYYAVAAISDRVAKNKWADRNQLGGFIWHTTGSGKTMTSFKAAQLIANSKDADKVIFLLDRIELGTQSIKEYRGFAEERESVQETKNTTMLRTRLKSKSPENTLIVTSIQKMSNIKEEDGMTDAELEEMRKNRIVFIIDEAHRSTFGEMMITIKETFPQALFFGFTGTPIKKENERKKNTTTSIFGQELHHYTIADGIRDKNVLGFDPYKVLIYKDREIREKVALNQSKASSVEEAVSKLEKSKVYYHFMDGSKVKMAGFMNRKGKYIKGIEDYIPKNQYLTPDYQKAVVKDICDNWLTLSRNGTFHAIFATSSIQEAISYYRLLKAIKPELRVTALFDPNVDNNDGFDFKEDALVEILTDYEKQYGQLYTLASHDRFKKDVSNRLAHKHQHKWIEREPEKQLDLLIVVNQMLTGFDSKWVNTLYVDQLMKDELIIQAFSRTNRIFGEDKPFGTIRYYRKPHTMERNIEDAVQLYSGDSPVELFVNKLDQNLVMLNARFYQIRDIFESSGVENFEKLPAERSEKAKFAKLFNSFNDYLESARIQGFKWSKLHYEISKGAGKKKSVVDVVCDETTYNILVIRYKELMSNGGGGKGPGDVPFDLSTSIIEIDTGMIDADYMNSRFQKYIKALGTEESESLLNELHKTFATLTQEEQKIANLILHDIQNGEIEVDSTLTLRDYINDYQVQIHYDRIKRLSDVFGLDEELLRQMMSMKLTETTLNEFGRFDSLKNSIDKQKAKSYFENITGETLIPFKVNVKTSDLLKRFILEGGFEV